MAFRTSSLHPFHQLTTGLYAHRDSLTLAHGLLSGLQRLIPSDYNSWKEVALSGPPRVTAVFLPQHPQASSLLPAYQRHIMDHPVHKHWRKSSSYHVAFRWSDVATPQAIEQTRLYDKYYRPLGIRHQLMVALEAAPSHLIYVALNRSRTPFTEEERTWLTALQPHASHALRHIRDLQQLQVTIASFSEFVDTLNHGVLCLSPDFQIRWASKQARHYLRSHLKWGDTTTRLPAVLHQWLLSSQQRLGKVPRTCSIQSQAGSLIARALTKQHLLYLFLESAEPQRTFEALKTLGLTNRESEVLGWVTGGKSNEETAAILGMGPQTVKKHLERIYDVLGVSNRTEAAVKAHAVLNRPASAPIA